MKKFLLLFFSFISIKSFTQAQRDSCFIGIYLKTLYDLSPSDFSFGADFYIWTNSNDSLPLFDKIEIINAKQINDYSSFSGKDSNRFVNYENCKAQLTHNWNLVDYPFDDQKFRVDIEAQEGIDFMHLSEDTNGFQISKGMIIPGWKIKDYYVESSFSTYPSDFGYHTIRTYDKRFNHLSFVIKASRNSWGLFFKLFAGLFISMLVSFLSFFVRPDFVDPRFGLSIGGLFASVANKYVVDSNIPATIGFSFVDMMHFLSFIFILITLIISALSLRHLSKGHIDKSKNLDRKSFKVSISVYLFLNLCLILWAIL